MIGEPYLMSNEATVLYADTIGACRISIADCHKTLVPVLNAGHVPCLHGEAGIGKTEVASQISSAMGVESKYFLPIIVSQVTCADLMIPFRGKDGKYFEIMLSEKFKRIFDAAEEGKPSFIFFDEVTRYQDAETASFIFSICSDRRIGNHTLPENCYVMAACNPDNGDYQVNTITEDPAWRRRFKHYVATHDVSGWLRWAKSSEIHEWVVDYISANIEMLLDEKARKAGKVYATPAGWAQVSTYLKANNNLLNVTNISGYIGYDLASDFVSYTEDSEFKLSPATVVTDWSATLEVLQRIEKAKRGDLITRLVTSVVLYIYSNKPSIPEVSKNLCKFWAHVSAESKVKLATELFNRKEEGDSYFSLLMSDISTNHLWRNKILPEVKHCMT